jgi:hypothetical protein
LEKMQQYAFEQTEVREMECPEKLSN